MRSIFFTSIIDMMSIISWVCLAVAAIASLVLLTICWKKWGKRDAVKSEMQLKQVNYASSLGMNVH